MLESQDAGLSRPARLVIRRARPDLRAWALPPFGAADGVVPGSSHLAQGA